jgi:hypothetical protein
MCLYELFKIFSPIVEITLLSSIQMDVVIDYFAASHIIPYTLYACNLHNKAQKNCGRFNICIYEPDTAPYISPMPFVR